MQISAGCQIIYHCPQPTPMLLMVSPHPSREPDLLGPAKLSFDPPHHVAGLYRRIRQPLHADRGAAGSAHHLNAPHCGRSGHD
jgi:hypothetical protein